MSDTNSIRQMFDSYAESINTGDLDRWVSFNTAHGVWLTPGHGPVKGLDAIRAYGDEAWFSLYEMKHRLTAEEIVLTSDTEAWAWGTWKMDLKPRDGSAEQTLRGTFLDVLRKKDDGWKLCKVCFNTID